jgi:hypothetical protein
MQTTPRKLIPAQAEVHSAAHNQDLIEVPKRARLDREAEGRTAPPVIPVSDNQRTTLRCQRSADSSSGACATLATQMFLSQNWNR